MQRVINARVIYLDRSVRGRQTQRIFQQNTIQLNDYGREFVQKERLEYSEGKFSEHENKVDCKCKDSRGGCLYIHNMRFSSKMMKGYGIRMTTHVS